MPKAGIGSAMPQCRGGSIYDFAKRLGIEAPAANQLTGEALFDYRDEDSKLLYQVVRFAGKNFKQRRPHGNGEWLWKLDGVRRVPYRLPELLKSAGNLFIVEGEKDVERFARMDLRRLATRAARANGIPNSANMSKAACAS